MTVRLPSAAHYAPQVEKEHRWLPRLAPLLPLPIPVPLAKGAPAEGYPWQWSVYRWLEGEAAAVGRVTDLRRFAITLAGFLGALQRAPQAGRCRVYDAETRQAVDALDGRIDTEAALAAWEAALGAEWGGPPVWLHGDVAAGNLLAEEGRLGAVIDFGCMGVGDPACDLAIAWMGAGSWLDAVEGPDHARRTHRHRPVAGGRGTTRDRRGVGRSQARRLTRTSASDGHPARDLIATVRLARRNVD